MIVISNPFESLFKEKLYLELKNHFYSFLRRRSEIQHRLRGQGPGRILEMGSGISPISANCEVVYSDISEASMKFLRENLLLPRVCVTRIEEIAFKASSASCVICSEVIEHVKRDDEALLEMARVTQPGGRLLLTVPVNMIYYSFDDQYVGHRRRYEISDLRERLKEVGFDRIQIVKIAGPLEKVFTMAGVLVFSKLKDGGRNQKLHSKLSRTLVFLYKVINHLLSLIIWLDAKLVPSRFSTILLFDCRKNESVG